MRFALELTIAFCLAPFENALGADKPKPMQVVFAADAMKLDQALAAIKKQTGVTVTLDKSLEDSIVKFSDRKLPFWQAVDQVARAAGARPYFYAGPRKILLQASDGGASTPISYDGIFRTALKRWGVSRNFETGAKDYSFALEAAWQPGFVPLYLQSKPRNLVIKNGKETSQPGDVGGSWTPLDGDVATTVNLTVPALKKDLTKIDSLSGELRVRGATAMTTLEFLSLTKMLGMKVPIQAIKGGATNPVSCEVVKAIGRQSRWSVQIAVTLPKSSPQFESFQSWTQRDEVYLKNNKTGKTVTANSQVELSSTGRRVEIEHHFTQPDVRAKPGDWTLHYQLPVSIVELPIRFDFRKLSLE